MILLFHKYAALKIKAKDQAQVYMFFAASAGTEDLYTKL